MNFPLSKEMGDRTRSEIFSLPHAIFHFLTRANAQWEIHGFTLAYTGVNSLIQHLTIICVVSATFICTHQRGKCHFHFLLAQRFLEQNDGHCLHGPSIPRFRKLSGSEILNQFSTYSARSQEQSHDNNIRLLV